MLGPYGFLPLNFVFALQIEGVMSEYIHDVPTYQRVRDLLLAEMEKGLGASTNAEATVKMFPTYVRALPDGSGNIDFIVT